MSEERLPVVSPSSGLPSASSTGPPAEVESRPLEVESSSLRLVTTLAVAGAFAGLVIVLVFQWANPHIEVWRARVLAEAVTEVLGGSERYQTAFLVGSDFAWAPQVDTTELDRIYVGYDGEGRPVGVAVVGGEPGFQDVIRLMFGYDPATGNVIGMKVLESKETPGLGDKIQKDSTFLEEFARVAFPLVGLKRGRERGADGEVTMITGATISSRAVIDIINHRLEVLREPIADFWASSLVEGGGR